MACLGCASSRQTGAITLHGGPRLACDRSRHALCAADRSLYRDSAARGNRAAPGRGCLPLALRATSAPGAYSTRGRPHRQLAQRRDHTASHVRKAEGIDRLPAEPKIGAEPVHEHGAQDMPVIRVSILTAEVAAKLGAAHSRKSTDPARLPSSTHLCRADLSGLESSRKPGSI